MAFLLVRLANEGSAQALDDKDEIQAEHDDTQGPAGKNKLHALVSAADASLWRLVPPPARHWKIT